MCLDVVLLRSKHNLCVFKRLKKERMLTVVFSCLVTPWSPRL